MRPEDSRIKGASKIRASLAISSVAATPEEVLAAVQKQLPALTVTLADAETGNTIQPNRDHGPAIK
jgi:hypothetical protein